MLTPRRPGQDKPNHILAIVTEGNACLEMTEDTLNTWWNNLAPEEKAEVFELHLGPAEDVSQNRALAPSCDPIAFETVVEQMQKRADLLLRGSFLPIPTTQH